MITKLQQIVDAVKAKGKVNLAVAYANDEHSIEAVHNAVKAGIVNATLVGEKAVIESVCKKLNINMQDFNIIEENNPVAAAQKAVSLIREGKAEVLMKGLVSTDVYMRAILNKEQGILPPKAILSHVCVMEVSSYPKLLTISDIAVIPAPERNQKVVMTKNVISVAKKLGVNEPKVALIAATEQVLEMQACLDAAIISKMAERGQISGGIVDGPLAVDVAIDKEAVEIKKLKSVVNGEADCMVFPNIESANAFFKGCTKLMKGEIAGVVLGAKVPCVLTSRGDTSATKLYSIALAALLAK